MTASDSILCMLETEQPPLERGLSEDLTNGRGRDEGKSARPKSHAPSRNARGLSMTIHDIQRLVASRMGTTVLELTSARMAQARPRQVAMWLAKQATPASFPAIGRAFRKDHTTVMQACRRVDALMATDLNFAGLVEDLRRAAT